MIKPEFVPLDVAETVQRIQPVIALLQKCKAKPAILGAIDGQSAAGKSTLAEMIKTTLPNVSIVHMNDFYRLMNEDERGGLDAEGAHYRYDR